MLNILVAPNEILTKVAEPVTFENPAAIEDNQLLAKAMIETAAGNNLYGLAAPQIAISVRMFVVDMSAGKGKERNFKAFYNPTIKGLKTGNPKVDRSLSEEFCASLPNVGCVVERWTRIKVTAFDATGAEFTTEASGMLARIIQHENSHIDGKLITDMAKQKRIIR